MRRALCLLLLAIAASGGAACGDDQADRLRERAQEFEARAKAQTERFRERVREILGEIERALPEAQRTSPAVQSGGRTSRGTIDEFLTKILRSIDAYWTTTLRANGLAVPVVNYDWIPPGVEHETACGPAGQDAAFYCPADDTVYIAQQFAADLWDGVVRGLPGERSGRAAGDFGVAYVVAHEYAHNLQQELGIFARDRGAATARPVELQADCLAGAWGNSVYRAGGLEPGDVEEAIGTALAVGDFDVNNAQHHGTPEERREAWLLGFKGGNPSDCERYVL